MELHSLAPNRPFDSLRVAEVIRADGTTDPGNDPRLEIDLVRRMYVAMVRTRIIDERMVALQRQGRIGFHVGSMGEEASIIGSAAALRSQDWIFPCYREFGALLWRGFPLQKYIDNLYGNVDDVVQGRQMPDHYTGKGFHFASVSAPIGTQIPHAVGFGWAAKLRKDDVVTAPFFGDGATSSNDFHAAMNFAGVFKVPTVFLLRNNRWAISVPAERQTASGSFAEKARGYGMVGLRCDGNDALAVYNTVRQAVERASQGHGPTLIELLTYRLSGHSTSDDPRVYRMDTEVEEWSKADPIMRLRTYLETQQAWGSDDEQSTRDAIEAELRECIERAETTPKPPLSSMFNDVYAEQPAHLQEQQAECENGLRPKGHHD